MKKFKDITCHVISAKTTGATPKGKPDDKGFLSDPRTICLTAALFLFFEFAQIGLINTLAPMLMQSLGIKAQQLGWLSAAYLLGNVFFLLPVGFLLDYFGSRKILLMAFSLSILGTWLFSCSANFTCALLARLLSGATGGACCFIGLVRLTTKWFPRRRSLAIGVLITVGNLGGVFSQYPFAYLVDLISWRYALMIFASCGLLALLAMYLVLQEPSATYIKPPFSFRSIMANIWQTVTNLQNWLAGIFICLLNLPILVLGAAWGVLYLTQAHHFSSLQASLITSMIYLGTLIGSPLNGWLSDRVGRRKPCMIVGAGLSLMVVLILLFNEQLSLFTAISLFLLLSACASAQDIGYSVLIESNPLPIISTTSAVGSMLVMGGGSLFQPLFGWLLALQGHSTLQSGLPFYSVENYQRALLLLPIAFLVSLTVACLIRETYCKIKDS